MSTPNLKAVGEETRWTPEEAREMAKRSAEARRQKKRIGDAVRILNEAFFESNLDFNDLKLDRNMVGKLSEEVAAVLLAKVRFELIEVKNAREAAQLIKLAYEIMLREAGEPGIDGIEDRRERIGELVSELEQRRKAKEQAAQEEPSRSDQAGQEGA